MTPKELPPNDTPLFDWVGIESFPAEPVFEGNFNSAPSRREFEYTLRKYVEEFRYVNTAQDIWQNDDDVVVVATMPWQEFTQMKNLHIIQHVGDLADFVSFAVDDKGLVLIRFWWD